MAPNSKWLVLPSDIFLLICAQYTPFCVSKLFDWHRFFYYTRMLHFGASHQAPSERKHLNTRCATGHKSYHVPRIFVSSTRDHLLF